jgi:hypothetical protein
MGILEKVAVNIASAYIRLVGITSKITIAGSPAALEFSKNRKPAIYAFWHNQQLFLLWVHRNENVLVLISQSKDGEYVARAAQGFGYGTVRGSTTRGGLKALVEVIDKLKNGFQVAFTPDGPKGPVYTVRSGVIMAAGRSGAPILPLACSVKRKSRLNSWDGFIIPYPFNRIAVFYGEPFYVAPGDDIDEKSATLGKILNELNAKAEALVEDRPA